MLAIILGQFFSSLPVLVGDLLIGTSGEELLDEWGMSKPNCIVHSRVPAKVLHVRIQLTFIQQTSYGLNVAPKSCLVQSSAPGVGLSPVHVSDVFIRPHALSATPC